MRFAVLTLFVALCASVCHAEFDPELIAERIRFFEQNPSGAPLALDVAAHQHTKFVFQAGLAGRYIPLYFGHAVKELETLTGTRGEKDIAKKRVFVFKGDDTKGLDENAELLQDEMEEISKADPDAKIIEVGHSMGAVTAWTAAMKNPKFFRDKILGAVFLQGPFGGSPIADFIVEGRPASDVEPIWNNPAMWAMRGGLLLPYRSQRIRPALESITEAAAKAHVAQIQAEYGESHTKDLQDKTLFLATSMPPQTGAKRFLNPLSFGMDVCVRSMAKLVEGPSDGMVLERSQFPPNVQHRTQVITGKNHIAFQATSSGTSLGKALYSISP